MTTPGLARRAWRGFRRLPGLVQAAAWFVLVIAVFGTVFGSDEDQNAAPSQSAASTQQQETEAATTDSAPASAPAPAKPRRFRATDAQVSALVEDVLGGQVSDSDRERVRAVSCMRGRCFIRYNADTPLWKPEKTLLEEARPIWKKLFSDRRLREAIIVPYGETTSVGGKKSTSPLMRVTCDHSSNAEIDWEAVDSHGIEALCDYQPLVNFE